MSTWCLQLQLINKKIWWRHQFLCLREQRNVLWRRSQFWKVKQQLNAVKLRYTLDHVDHSPDFQWPLWRHRGSIVRRAKDLDLVEDCKQQKEDRIYTVNIVDLVKSDYDIINGILLETRLHMYLSCRWFGHGLRFRHCQLEQT